MNNTDLSFIVDGIALKNLPKGKLTEFCPLVYDCQKQGGDTNCFYKKFLHCDQVDKLGLNSKLSSEDIQNRKVYKGKITNNISDANKD